MLFVMWLVEPMTLFFFFFLSCWYRDIFFDTDGDSCHDAGILSDAQKENVLTSVVADFGFSASSAGATLSESPEFSDDNTLVFSVLSSLPEDTVAAIIEAIIGVGSEFIQVEPQRRARLLAAGEERVLFVTVNLDGLLSKLRSDADFDGVDNDVDSCPFDPENDADGDSLCKLSFCFDDLFVLNPQCTDFRSGGRLDGQCVESGVCTTCACSCNAECAGVIGGGSDICPYEAANDADSDLLCASDDPCPFDATNDADSDDLCGETVACVETDEAVTSFGSCSDYSEGSRYFGFCSIDGICDICPCSCASECGSEVDTCPSDPENDVDADQLCADMDSCPYDPENDVDSDNVCSSGDSCPDDPENDLDGDGICGASDSCPFDAFNDADGDRVCADVDSCPLSATGDRDQDGLCDNIDSCPLDADNDADADDMCGDEDPCPQDSSNACNDANNGVVVDGDGLIIDDEMLVIIIGIVCGVHSEQLLRHQTHPRT